MDLLTLFRVLIRRWYVVIPTLTLTVAVALSALSNIEPEYEANASVLLLSPNVIIDDSGGEIVQNPLLLRNNAIPIAAEATARIMRSADVRRDIRAQGIVGNYNVAVDNSGAILNLSSTATNQGEAIETINVVADRIAVEIDRLAGAAVPELQRIGTELLDPPRFARRNTVEETRAIVAVGALGIAAAVAIALAVESLTSGSTRSPSRRRPAAGGGGRPGPGDGGGGPGDGDDEPGPNGNGNNVVTTGSGTVEATARPRR